MNPIQKNKVFLFPSLFLTFLQIKSLLDIFVFIHLYKRLMKHALYLLTFVSFVCYRCIISHLNLKIINFSFPSKLEFEKNYGTQRGGIIKPIPLSLKLHLNS